MHKDAAQKAHERCPKKDVQRAHADQRSVVIRRSVVRFPTRCLYWLRLCSGRCPRPAGREDGLGVRLLVADFLLLPAGQCPVHTVRTE